MNNIKLTLEYDGTNYYGWQKQKGMKTIQGEIEEALFLVTKEKCEVTGSSRTDAGVHAKGFIANFKTNSNVPPERFREALNVKLPNDIVVVKSEKVEDDFHARYCAKGKTYEYYILNDQVPSALMRNQVYHYKYDLNIEAMKEGAQQFIGTHDFAAFKTQGSSVKGTIRTIFDVKVEKTEKIIKISVSGDGFLYNMVRIIVGTLINVGRGKTPASSISNIIAQKDRTLAGDCVPPNGLLLKEVYY
ncbi:tRNA pseudouridine(38-40) synthase TruA [uncultured Clostridium sp.]|uniref:tRNA pseudouridine(38-40) synthase TruA n=1 Tax=Clostridium sp. TaxID=1506 RepID=UPI0025E49234|nr:tRNA pseudouridine(38-40) synthase TruA [uncultured Clostridium sp.]